jgi:hypothetical protein
MSKQSQGVFSFFFKLDTPMSFVSRDQVRIVVTHGLTFGGHGLLDSF